MKLFKRKLKRMCYIAYTVDIDRQSPVPLGFRLFEMLSFKNNVFIQFFRMDETYFKLSRVEELGYQLIEDKKRTDVKYLSIENEYDNQSLASIVDLQKFDDAQGISCFFRCNQTDKTEIMTYFMKEELLNEKKIKCLGGIDIDSIDLEFDPDYYLENQSQIEQTLKEFEETYKEYVYDKYVKIKL